MMAQNIRRTDMGSGISGGVLGQKTVFLIAPVEDAQVGFAFFSQDTQVRVFAPRFLIAPIEGTQVVRDTPRALGCSFWRKIIKQVCWWSTGLMDDF
jgi:hypothetical protein